MSTRPFYALGCRPDATGSPTDYVYPGQILYLWSPNGQLAMDVSGYTGDVGILVPYPPTWYVNLDRVNAYVMAFKVTASEGWVIGESYYVTWTDPTNPDNILRFTVTAAADPTPNNPYLIPPASSFTDVSSAQSYIQAAISAGYSPILLSAGDYPISSPFDLTGPYVAPIVTIDGQNWASLTSTTDLGEYYYMFNVTKPLNLKRLSFYKSNLDLDQRVLGSSFPQNVNVNISLCRFVDTSIGQFYLADYDPDSGDYDANVTGIVVERCEFVRASTNEIPTGAVFAFCRFTETPQSGGIHPFYPTSKKWLTYSCDWIRTPRGIVCQGRLANPIKNGVVASCRFWDIIQGVWAGGEVLAMESNFGEDDTHFSNAFVMCHIYNCGGSGISMYGSGMHDNLFQNITLDTRAASFDIQAYADGGGTFDAIYNNIFEYIEMEAPLNLLGHLYGNSFNNIVAQQNPLRNGGVAPGDPAHAYGYNPATLSQGTPMFSDTSTKAALEEANQWQNVLMSGRNGLTPIVLPPKFVAPST